MTDLATAERRVADLVAVLRALQGQLEGLLDVEDCGKQSRRLVQGMVGTIQQKVKEAGR